MQSAVNIVRGTGSSNVIMLPGLAYANQWSCNNDESAVTCGALNSGTPPVTDPDSDLMAEADIYPEGNACGSTTCYNTAYKSISSVMPFVAGEMGENPANGYEPTTDVDTLMSWLDANGNGYFPYAWDAWGHLIPGYGNNSTPVTEWGVDYYDHINGITPPSPTQPTDGITFPWSLPSDCVGLSNGSLNPVSTTPAVSAGDDLFAVFGGQGYGSTGSTIASVSDSVNGAWTPLERSTSQVSVSNGTSFYAAYSVFELTGSKAAAGGLTLTVNGTAGQSPQVSGVVFDARGAASIAASSFQSTINAYAATATGPTLTSVPSGDVVLGLWGGYSTDETYTAPVRVEYRADRADRTRPVRRRGDGLDANLVHRECGSDDQRQHQRGRPGALVRRGGGPAPMRNATPEQVELAVKRFGPDRAGHELRKRGLMPPIAGGSGFTVRTPVGSDSTTATLASLAAGDFLWLVWAGIEYQKRRIRCHPSAIRRMGRGRSSITRAR